MSTISGSKRSVTKTFLGKKNILVTWIKIAQFIKISKFVLSLYTKSSIHVNK